MTASLAAFDMPEQVCIRDLRRLPLGPGDYDVETAVWWTLHLQHLDRVDMAVVWHRTATLPAYERSLLTEQIGVSGPAWSEVMTEADEHGALHLDLMFVGRPQGLLAGCRLLIQHLLPNRTVSWDVSTAGDWEQIVRG